MSDDVFILSYMLVILPAYYDYFLL